MMSPGLEDALATHRCRELTRSVKKLIQLREKSIERLDQFANHLHQLNKDENISKVVGSLVAIAGTLAVAGSAIATVASFGAAAPLLAASIAGSSVAMAGASVGIGAGAMCGSLVEQDLKAAKDLIDQDVMIYNKVVRLATLVENDYRKRNTAIQIEVGSEVGALVGGAAAGGGGIAAAAVGLAGTVKARNAALGGAVLAEGVAEKGARTAANLLNASKIVAGVAIALTVPAVALDIYNIIKSGKCLANDTPTIAEEQVRQAAEEMADHLIESRHLLEQLESISNPF